MYTKELYLELLSLTEMYLVQENSGYKWVEASLENYNFFKLVSKERKITQPSIPTAPKQGQQRNLASEKIIPARTEPPKKEMVAESKKMEKVVVANSSVQEKFTPQSQQSLHEPLPVPVKIVDLSDMKLLMEQKFSAITLLPHPSDDQPVVFFIYDQQFKEQFLFLSAIAKAIKERQVATRLVSFQESEQENFASLNHLIIMIRSSFEKCLNLKQKGQALSLLLLEEPSIYQEDPIKKRALWNEIKARLALS